MRDGRTAAAGRRIVERLIVITDRILCEAPYRSVTLKRAAMPGHAGHWKPR
jgi:hypothetical protein